ncbi:DNA polymerase I [Thermosulfuriphilus sp.]
MNKNDRLYLIDASSYVFRAYFAISGHLSNRRGLPTKAIFGFSNMVWKILRERKPRYLALVFDAKGPTFRHEMFAAYKANRPEMPEDLAIQLPYIKEIGQAFGLPILEIEGYEADDIIATLARKINHPVVIVSGDKDFLQLVGERVILWDPMKDVLYDRQSVKRRFGIPPERLLDVMALTGDPSDNIPGVPGIGEKTALKLIREFGSLEALLEQKERIPRKRLRELLETHAELARLSKELVRLRDDAPVSLSLEDYLLGEPDWGRLRFLFREFEFNRLLKELPAEKTISYEAYQLIRDEEKLCRLVAKARKNSPVVIDIEATDKDPLRAEIVGVAFCFEPPKAYYVPIGHRGLTSGPQLDLKTVLMVLKDLIEDEKVRLVGQNIKYDLILLRRQGLEIKGLEGDTMVASYLLNPIRRAHNLDDLAQEYLGHQMVSYKDLALGKGEDFADVDVETAKVYACEDAHVTYLLYQKMWPLLKEHGLWPLFVKVEVPLIYVLAEMEMMGVKIDLAYLQGLSREFERRLLELEARIHALAGEAFNINSTRRLGAILFDKLGLPRLKKTRKKTGYSTDVEVLEELAELHELPRLVLEYRTLSKLKSTYVDALPKMVNPADGRLHTSFNQTVTATGRLSSSEPNLQNIPVRGEEGAKIRRAFVPEEGYLLLSADYSQIDLRVLAHYSEDRTLIEAFRRGEDIHTRTAMEIFGVSQEMVTPEMRRLAKTINFGIVYGMSPYGLSKELKIGRREAAAFIERYFERYPGVRDYMQKIVAEARQKGYVATVLGRKRYLPDIVSPNRVAREFAERTAINTPIQGSAADIIKLAMIDIYGAIKRGELRARMILQVHDELLFEVPEEEILEAKERIRELMEGVFSLKVPLKVNLSWGKNWAELK